MTPLQQVQSDFVDLFVADVEEFPSAYKEMIRAQPGLWAMRIVAQLSEPEVRKMIQNLTAERSMVARVRGGTTPRQGAQP